MADDKPIQVSQEQRRLWSWIEKQGGDKDWVNLKEYVKKYGGQSREVARLVELGVLEKNRLPQKTGQIETKLKPNAKNIGWVMKPSAVGQARAIVAGKKYGKKPGLVGGEIIPFLTRDMFAPAQQALNDLDDMEKKLSLEARNEVIKRMDAIMARIHDDYSTAAIAELEREAKKLRGMDDRNFREEARAKLQADKSYAHRDLMKYLK